MRSKICLVLSFKSLTTRYCTHFFLKSYNVCWKLASYNPTPEHLLLLCCDFTWQSSPLVRTSPFMYCLSRDGEIPKLLPIQSTSTRPSWWLISTAPFRMTYQRSSCQQTIAGETFVTRRLHLDKNQCCPCIHCTCMFFNTFFHILEFFPSKFFFK